MKLYGVRTANCAVIVLMLTWCNLFVRIVLFLNLSFSILFSSCAHVCIGRECAMFVECERADELQRSAKTSLNAL